MIENVQAQHTSIGFFFSDIFCDVDWEWYLPRAQSFELVLWQAMTKLLK